MNTHRLTLPVLLLAFTLTGCQSGGSPNFKTGTGSMDMFTPLKVRLHPLSRVVPAEKDPNSGGVVEGRLEFTDQFGDVTKSPGALYFELFRYEALIPDHHGDRITLWTFDLSTPQSNKDHWDGITRTYLFKLPLAKDALKNEKRVVLSATLTLPNTPDGKPGERLRDELPLTIK